MYCPNCKTEYRKEFKNCADCNVALVTELPEETVVFDKSTNQRIEYVDWQPLLTVTTDKQALIMASILKSEGIPVFSSALGIGGYMQIATGGTIFGMEILVPKEFLEKAQETIKAYKETELPKMIDNEDDDVESVCKQKITLFSLLIMAIFILLLITWLIYRLLLV